MKHELKTNSVYFNQILDGMKKFELRKNDRNFQVGDLLVLKEYDAGIYSGRSFETKITYILKDFIGLDNEYAILSISELFNFENIPEKEKRNKPLRKVHPKCTGNDISIKVKKLDLFYDNKPQTNIGYHNVKVGICPLCEMLVLKKRGVYINIMLDDLRHIYVDGNDIYYKYGGVYD